jgi:hypothetical protein
MEQTIQMGRTQVQVFMVEAATLYRSILRFDFR